MPMQTTDGSTCFRLEAVLDRTKDRGGGGGGCPRLMETEQNNASVINPDKNANLAKRADCPHEEYQFTLTTAPNAPGASHLEKKVQDSSVGFQESF